jgi:hypothetical protein
VSFRWVPRPQRPRDADNLPFAGRFVATVVDQKMGLDDKRNGLRILTTVAPGRAAASAFKVTVERLGGSLAALVYHAREPTNVITGDGNYVLPKRMPRGRRPWFATRFLRVTDGRTTTMLRRDGVRFSTRGRQAERCRRRCR